MIIATTVVAMLRLMTGRVLPLPHLLQRGPMPHINHDPPQAAAAYPPSFPEGTQRERSVAERGRASNYPIGAPRYQGTKAPKHQGSVLRTPGCDETTAANRRGATPRSLRSLAVIRPVLNPAPPPPLFGQTLVPFVHPPLPQARLAFQSSIPAIHIHHCGRFICGSACAAPCRSLPLLLLSLLRGHEVHSVSSLRRGHFSASDVQFSLVLDSSSPCPLSGCPACASRTPPCRAFLARRRKATKSTGPR